MVPGNGRLLSAAKGETTLPVSSEPIVGSILRPLLEPIVLDQLFPKVEHETKIWVLVVSEK